MQLSGRYRLDAQIGSGGMSTVYRAFDQTLERQVAIKLMHREIASDSDQLERFRREARAVAQLSHPHIVGVIDAGEDEGRPYIVFEYVEGETLKDRIRRMGRLPMDEAIAYAIEISRALGCAHARHIVHRDVKPQNVLIDAEGSAKVTDFGIARTLDQDGLTADGRVLGTTDYVSPEQALGHDVNGQSDIYSLGVVLYEMLTGDVPFHGENQVSVAMKHVREDMPDLQARRPEASATLASVLDRMTDKDLMRRYPDIETLVADLEESLAIEAARSGRSTGEATAVLRTLPPQARRRLPFRMRHPLPVAATVLLLVVGASLVVLLLKEGVNWITESYSSGLEGANKDGVGIYVDAKPGVEAVRMEIQSPETGWRAEIFGATGSRVPESIASGWQRLGGGEVRSDHQRFKLADSGERYRYYLVWITDLPPDSQRVEIGEIALLQRNATR
jgi:serine/threonine-protein kinase